MESEIKPPRRMAKLSWHGGFAPNGHRSLYACLADTAHWLCRVNS